MIVPIMDRILVRRLEVAPTPDKLIEIPDQYQQKTNRCVVVAVGNFVAIGSSTFPVSDFVKPGDIVIIGDYNCEDVKVDGIDMVLVSIHDVRAKENAHAQ